MKFYIKVYQLCGNAVGGVKLLRAEAFETAKLMNEEYNKMRTSLPVDQFASCDTNMN